MQRFLTRTRERLGAPVRNLALPPLEPPAWLEHDALRASFDAKEQLLATGTVRWGFVIQANTVLWEAGEGDNVMAVLVGSDDASDAAPGALHYTANALHELRASETPDPADVPVEVAAIATYLSAELERSQALPVPSSWNRGVPSAVYTVLCYRAFLPGGFLKRRLLPMLVGETPEHGALVVPSEYWDAPLQEVWS